MLSVRILTALALLPLAYVLVFLLPPAGFAIAAALVLLLGSWEYRKLAGLTKRPAGYLLVGLQAVLFVLLIVYRDAWSQNPGRVFFLACLAWLIMFMQLRLFAPGTKPDRVYASRAFLDALGSITFAWMALGWLRYQPAGQWWILVLLLTIWASDVGAYFTGRALGRHKLAPAISPGKTREGLIGGLVLAALVPALAITVIPALSAAPGKLALIGLVTALASVGGDLLISLHKRVVGCKDTGRILPGHGGLLDRLDSLLAGAPFFALGKILAGF